MMVSEESRQYIERKLTDAFRNALIELRDQGHIKQRHITYIYEKGHIEITIPPDRP